MNKSLFCRVGDVQCKQFHFFCSDFKHPLLRIICNVKKTQKKIHFSLYPQPPPQLKSNPPSSLSPSFYNTRISVRTRPRQIIRPPPPSLPTKNHLSEHMCAEPDDMVQENGFGNQSLTSQLQARWSVFQNYFIL